jgi:dTDP-4-dehydrorhamnose reductase
MILLLGGRGYVGQAFARELRRRGWDFIAPSRAELDYTRFDIIAETLRRQRPSLVINAAGYSGKPNVDACEVARAETLIGNVILPQVLAIACAQAGVPFGHVSSGCIYSGAKIQDSSGVRVEKDLAQPGVKDLFAKHPDQFAGFTEADEPNFSFRQPPCSFYSGSKALAEELVRELGQTYVWRMRLPFDEFDGPRNYLSKLQRYPKVYDNINSLSHRTDFVCACLELWERRAPFGVYNVTNPGAVSTRQVVERIQAILAPNRRFEFWASDEEFYRVAVKTPRSNCILDMSKLLAAGVRIRPITDALQHALHNWVPESPS